MMPTVTLDKKKVLELIGKKVSDEVLLDRIPMLGTDLEKIDDNEIVVEIFPNRPDMLSEEGFSRALSSFMGIKQGFREYDVKSEKSTVVVKGLPKEWPYGICAIVRGLEFDDEKLRSIIQLQEKLGVTLLRKRKKGGIGLYPLDKIKLPVTFTAYDKGKVKFRPLEYEKELSGDDILLKHPTGREYAHLVRGWKKYPVFVDAGGVIMSMPPIINSHDVGKVIEGTQDIFVECTGTDLNTLKVAINIMLTALADMGGTIYSLQMDYGTDKFECPDLSARKMKVDVGYVNKLLGIELSSADVKGLLAKMGIGFENGCALVPAYRVDVLHPMDVVEDVAIAYGYENFSEEIPNISTVGEEAGETVFVRKVSEVACGFGLLECMSYHLSNKEHLVRFMRKKDVDVVLAANAVNVEYTALRNAILPGLIKVLSENTLYEYPQKLFEVGKVVRPDESSEARVAEVLSMSCVVADAASEFSEIKALLLGIFSGIGVDCELREARNSTYIDGRCAEVFVSGKSVGFVGEIHPEVLCNFGVEVPVSAFEVEIGDVCSF